MKKTLLTMMGLASAVLAPSQVAAHLTYTDITSVTPTVSGGIRIHSISGLLTGNAGWASAADANLGDSHLGEWVRFTLSERSPVKIEVLRNPATQHIDIGGNSFLFQAGDLTPSFSIYSGVLPDMAYDTAVALPVPDGNDGRWNALGDTTMANEDGTISTIGYLGHAGAIDSLASSVAWSGVLDSGVYTVAIGGSCGSDECLDDTINRGYFMNLTVVPVPGAAWLMLSALVGFAGLARRKAS